MEKRLAKIESASLNIKDRGILTFWVHVEYEEGCHQGVGGIALDGWSEEKQDRVGTAGGCELIRQLLLCLDVDDLSRAKGKIIWVIGEGEGLSFRPKGIEALRVNKSPVQRVVWKEVFEMFEEGGA